MNGVDMEVKGLPMHIKPLKVQAYLRVTTNSAVSLIPSQCGKKVVLAWCWGEQRWVQP
jgi:hypothetical protein